MNNMILLFTCLGNVILSRYFVLKTSDLEDKHTRMVEEEENCRIIKISTKTDAG
jgi:hypothetical protein